MTASIDIRQVTKRFGSLIVLDELSLSIPAHEFVVFLGPSGCGKSTLLRMIAGLESVDSGEILINGERIDNQPPGQRGVAMVFQSYALYPHMTVRDNMAFGLKNISVERSAIDVRIAEAARMLEIGHLLDRKPGQLSGGQRQRVAIGRAIVRQPTAFLFDEPLSNLDAALRVSMRLEISELHQQLGTTMIYVTHDQVEAMTMADKIVVLSAGKIEQVGSPLELYHRPNNLFVAGFIGSPKMNVLKVQVSASEGAAVARMAGVDVSIPTHGVSVSAGEMSFGIRPEHIDATGHGDFVIEATVKLAEYLGSETLFFVTLADGSELSVKADGLASEKPGQTLRLGINAKACHLFDKDGKAVINGDLTR